MKVPLAINSPNITESMISDVAVMPYNNESDAFPVCQLSGAINPSDCTFIPKKDWLTSPAIVKGVHGVYVCDNVKSGGFLPIGHQLDRNYNGTDYPYGKLHNSGWYVLPHTGWTSDEKTIIKNCSLSGGCLPGCPVYPECKNWGTSENICASGCIAKNMCLSKYNSIFVS